MGVAPTGPVQGLAARGTHHEGHGKGSTCMRPLELALDENLD